MDITEKNKISYDKISDAWQAYRENMPVNKCIVEFTKLIKPCGRVLDIGCGTGRPIAAYLAAEGFAVTGIDISHEMIKKAQNLKSANAKFAVCDINNYSSDEKFDGVIAFDSLWHIPKSRQPDVYKKISSLMNKGAYLIFTHGRKNGDIDGTMFGERFYYSALSFDKVNAILSDTGLTIITSIENYKEQTTGERDLLIVAQKF